MVPVFIKTNIQSKLMNTLIISYHDSMQALNPWRVKLAH